MQRGVQQRVIGGNSCTQPRRGTPLTSATRATNIARSSRSASKLNVASVAQAHNLVKFSNYGKYLGNSLAVIDFTSRVGKVHNSYQSGGDWERDMFIESSSFAASALAGTAAVKTGGLMFMMVATPVGWMGLIVTGVVVAGVAAGASIWTSNKVKSSGGEVYDDIMNWIKHYYDNRKSYFSCFDSEWVFFCDSLCRLWSSHRA